jgi:hypothetical protein
MVRNVVVATSLLVALSAFAATLPEAFSCGREGSAGGLGAGTDLVRHTVDLAKFPEAVCNDGTPAVFYYGAATKVEDRDKWIVFLQGGGACYDGQTCAQRWCSTDTNYGLDKMSTSLSKPAIRANGFLNPTADNRFGSWNRVLIFYCSSDAWNGDSVRTLQASANNATRDYEIYFRGAKIVSGVIDTLRNATPSARRRVARHSAGDEEAASAWPDLDDANAVILAGSSAGGAGVRANLDRVGAKLRATNPDVDYRGIIDAIYATQSENRDFTKSTYCAADPARGCSYESFMKGTRQAIEVDLYGAREDESCLEWHRSNAPGTEWRCSDGEHVQLHHLSTPWFTRIDLLDESIGGDYVEREFGAPADFARAVESEMRDLPIPEEPRGATPGQFIPQCTHHESFTDNQRVFNVRLAGASWHDVVWNWWTGTQPQQRIRPFTGTVGPAPECPAE